MKLISTRFLFYVLGIIGFAPIFAFAQNADTVVKAGSDKPAESTNPVVLIVIIGALALAPFALIMLTSFVKIAVVLSILRNALGTQQVPPNQVITGIAMIMTIFIMAPVVDKMRTEAGIVDNTEAIFSANSVREVINASQRGKEPLREFLIRFSDEKHRIMFFNLAQQMAVANKTDPQAIDIKEFRIIVPGFVTTQLTQAFQIGFLLFIPFLVIDMVVANILQAMGMFMLSPTIISLPFKLLLFVMIDGWELLLKHLVMGYV